MRSTTKLRQLLARPGMLIAPGAHDVMTARLVEAEGFDAVYLGGFAASASALGVPDHSLITMTERLDHARNVAAAVNIPILADIDDGGGTPLSVRRTIRLAEQSGLAAVHCLNSGLRTRITVSPSVYRSIKYGPVAGIGVVPAGVSGVPPGVGGRFRFWVL